MPRHRGFNLGRFTFGIRLETLQHYFDQLQPAAAGDARLTFDAVDAMTDWLNAPENAEASGLVLEEWHRINDICVHGGFQLLRAYDRSDVPCDTDQPIEELAMRLFLEDRRAFDYAWSYYVLQTPGPRVSQYRLRAGEMEFTTRDASDLEHFLGRMFQQQKMGANCHVRVNRDESAVLVLVSRGTHMRTVMRWKGADVTFETFRPVIEDVMIYEPDTSRLSVRAGFNRDRDLYVRSIARILAGNQDLADAALTERIFDLTPIATGAFNYKGDGAVRRVVLKEAEISISVLGKTALVIKSDDVMRTLRDDLPEISLTRGELRRVKLLFEIRPDAQGRMYRVSFEIEPPAFSEFSVKAHAAYIDRYLRAQKVKLL